MAASQGIAPHLLHRSSGSTAHEAVTTNRQLQCPLPFSPAHRRQRPRSRPTARVVRALTANIVMQRSTEASTPACTVALSPKAIASNSALQSPQASPHGQIPIASLHRRRPPPAISCLGASRTPAATARGWPHHAGVRETCTEVEVAFHQTYRATPLSVLGEQRAFDAAQR